MSILIQRSASVFRIRASVTCSFGRLISDPSELRMNWAERFVLQTLLTGLELRRIVTSKSLS
jgi:hypothetical protein